MMRAFAWGRIARELLLALLAVACALVILVPGIWAVDLLLRAGLIPLLVVTALVGALLLLYQARLRPSLREPVMRAAAGIAEALRGVEEAEATRSAPSAFRAWSGVPIAALRVSVHRSQDGMPNPLAYALCAQVRSRAADTSTLNWALSEVGGSRLLLIQEPEVIGAPIPPLRGPLALSCESEETYYHLWSAHGAASYEEPVAFSTVLIAQAVAGREPELHDLSVRMAERVARLPDIAGVEVLQSEAHGSEAPRFLWLAAGTNRSVRRQVYLALEPSSSAQGLAWAIDRYDLLACDAYAMLHLPAAAAAPLERLGS